MLKKWEWETIELVRAYKPFATASRKFHSGCRLSEESMGWGWDWHLFAGAGLWWILWDYNAQGSWAKRVGGGDENKDPKDSLLGRKRDGEKKDCFPEVTGGMKWSSSGSEVTAVNHSESQEGEVEPATAHLGSGPQT